MEDASSTLHLRDPALRLPAVAAALALLAACGGSSPAIAPGSMPATLAQPRPERSWMDPQAAKEQLLYVTSGRNAFVYAFPKIKLVGTLANLRRPAGVCTDTAGNVFITELAAQRITEFAHGGTKRIATLADQGEEPIDCSFDPTTGNLAVANFASTSFSQGNVAIYTRAGGTPATYAPPGGSAEWFSVNSCGYDASGNLYFDGVDYDGFTVDGELQSGASSTRLIIVLQSFAGPGKVQWDGTYVTLADQSTGTIYQFTDGNTLIEKGSVTLDGSKRVNQSWIAGGSVIAPQADGNDVLFYTYPAGGTPVRRMRGIRMPYGAAISVPGST
jgi:hypothetical protein